MKPFNLEEALAGNPVQLRGGAKAYIYYKFPDSAKKEFNFPLVFPLIGCVVNDMEQVTNSTCTWRVNGMNDDELLNDKYDIVGMWEERTPTITLTLPKPFKPKQDEIYYSISDLYIKPEKNVARCLDAASIKIGNCFRKEEDAQAWIDAMRDAVYE